MQAALGMQNKCFLPMEATKSKGNQCVLHVRARQCMQNQCFLHMKNGKCQQNRIEVNECVMHVAALAGELKLPACFSHACLFEVSLERMFVN